jgi:hypothetical protein
MEGVSDITTADGNDTVTATNMTATATDNDLTGNEGFDDVQAATITTGAGDDTITVAELQSVADWDNNGTEDNNNNDRQYFKGATISSGAGDDTITFAQLDEGASIDAGAGADELNVGLNTIATILTRDTHDNQLTLNTDTAAAADGQRTNEVGLDGTVDLLGAIVDGGADADSITFTESNTVTDATAGVDLAETTQTTYNVIGVDAELRNVETVTVKALDIVNVVATSTMADQDSVTAGVQNDINANVLASSTTN